MKMNIYLLLLFSILIIGCVDPGPERISLTNVVNPSETHSDEIWGNINKDSLAEKFVNKPLTIAVVVELFGGNAFYWPVGSGFAVNQNTVFTNAHVAVGCIHVFNQIGSIYDGTMVVSKNYCAFKDSGNSKILLNSFTLFDNQFLISDDSLGNLIGYYLPDLAWAKTKTVTIDTSYIFSIASSSDIDNLEWKDPLFFVGFPYANKDKPVFGKSHFMDFEDDSYAIKKDMVLAIYDEKIYFGCSGSPLLNLEGNVVAVVFAHNQIFKYNYCVRADIIDSLLNN